MQIPPCGIGDTRPESIRVNAFYHVCFLEAQGLFFLAQSRTFAHVGVVHVVDVVDLAGADVQRRLPFVDACIRDRGKSNQLAKKGSTTTYDGPSQPLVLPEEPTDIVPVRRTPKQRGRQAHARQTRTLPGVPAACGKHQLVLL